MAPHAFAADAPAAGASPAQAQAPGATTPDTGEVIVTARRRSETLQSTPIAITAINTQMLEDKAAVNLSDLQGAAPGLLITQQNAGAAAANLSIRGLTYANIEKSQTPTVGVVVDGVTIGTNTGQLQDVFDVAQIEVLRGPQGTLFGANTIGGVINIQRSLPTMEPGAKLEFTYGQWNTWSGKGIVNYGNGSTWGVKGWYFHDQTDGYYWNALYDRRAGGSRDDNFGGSLLFKPAGSTFDGQLTIEDLVQSFDPVNSTLTNKNDLFCSLVAAVACNRNNTTDLYTTFDTAGHATYNAPAVTLQMHVDADWVKLTSITGWRHSYEDQGQAYGTGTLYFSLRRQHYTQWSQELRGAGKILPNLDYVVGGYFFDSTYDLTQWQGGPSLNTAPDPTAISPDPQFVTGHTRSYAVFGDFDWTIIPTVRLSFGGRWSHDQKQLDNSFLQTGVIGNGNANFSKFTPKIGLDWRPNSNVMLYGSWSVGYRSGGFSPRAADPITASTPFGPETLDAFEIGTKLSTPDHRATLDIAGFISNYKNMQQDTTIPGPAAAGGSQTVTSNVGGAVIRGIEMDSALLVTSKLKLTATASLMESHFHGFVTGNACSPVASSALVCPTANGGLVNYDYSANRLIYAPTFSGSVNAEYTQPTSFGKVVTTVGWRHISPYDEQISVGGISSVTASPANPSQIGLETVSGNDPRVRTVTQNLVDASVTVDFKLHGMDAYARVFGRNLANVQTTSAAFTVAGLFAFASAIEPRTYGATIGVKF
ncbi:MAG: TonB-dependent receptor [Sphingomonadales bacterium]|nr:TonB-dependent receptor [Sphingomonadales bacterium]